MNSANVAKLAETTASKNEREPAQIPRHNSKANPAKVPQKIRCLATLSLVQQTAASPNGQVLEIAIKLADPVSRKERELVQIRRQLTVERTVKAL